MKVPITHKVFSVSGFLLSGWLFLFPGIFIKLPDESVKQFASIKIPDNKLKQVYISMMIKEKIKNVFKIFQKR
jgi:hypothetical protein